MAHAGTMDLGESARTKPSGRRWPVVVLTLVVVLAAIAAVGFASSAGLVGGTSVKPAADRSYDAIEAHRGAVVLSSDAMQARDEYLNGILDLAHAAPYAAATQVRPYRDVRHRPAGQGGPTLPVQVTRDRVGGP